MSDREQVREWVAQATEITGVGGEWEEFLVNLAIAESGGNPQSDRIGRGVFCLSPTIFDMFCDPAYDDIWNPVDNTVAAIRYIQARYGSPQGLATMVDPVPR